MKVMIIDTVGTQFPDYFKAYFPNVKIRGYDLTSQKATHPHGWQCGYYATVLLNLLPGTHEAVYVRIFDAAGRPIPNSNNWMLEVIEHERPDIISNSWGQSDFDARFGDHVANMTWRAWVAKYEQLTAGTGSFFAAGNSDQNDPDPDVDYPGALAKNSCIIGAHRRNGIPSEFSGDGHQVLCSFWAQNVQLLSGEGWERGSGTSFACPKAAGLAAYLQLNSADFKAYAIAHASKPDYYVGQLPNVKWGWGSLEHKYQEKLSMLRADLLPPRLAAINDETRWQDFNLVV